MAYEMDPESWGGGLRPPPSKAPGGPLKIGLFWYFFLIFRKSTLYFSSTWDEKFCQALCPVSVSISCLLVSLFYSKDTRADIIMGVPPTTANFFWSHMKDMTEIRLFYSGTMVLILPRLKYIVNFIFLKCNIYIDSL